jgi:Alpha/beta hydrolase domain
MDGMEEAAMSVALLTHSGDPNARRVIAAIFAASAMGLICDADARITTIDNATGPTVMFGGARFGANQCQYEQLTFTAHGEVDPQDPLDALIQDIGDAPLDSSGKVAYSTQLIILRPSKPCLGNQTMLFEIVNRGNRLNPGFFNVGATALTPQGDGFLENQGFTLVWAGWQADLVQPPGGNLVTMFPGSSPPIARAGRDDRIYGPVRSEFTVTKPTSTLNILDESSTNTPGYPTASLDTTRATMTMRVHQNDPKAPISSSDWAFADCTIVPFPGTQNRQKVCLRNGFDTNHIYELLYTARDPIVMGLGLAAIRDVGSFLRYSAADDAGTPNPLAGGIKYALLNGISQSGRLLRTFLELGFNQDEQLRQVYDGMQPHIGSVRNYINVRFSQPGRLAGTQHTEQQYPGPEGPLTYGDSFDKFTGQTSGLLDRCTQTHTCPLIVHTMSDIEYWEAAGAFDTVQADGSADEQIPSNVRIYQFSSTQHGGFSPVASLPTSTGICEQLPNTNSYTYNIRALLVALQQWVATGKRPPASQYSSLGHLSLVPPGAVSFPVIPCMAGLVACGGPTGAGPNASGPDSQGGIWNTRSVWNRGSRYNSADVSGSISIEPPTLVAQYPTLLPQVDADGNDIDGLRSVTLQAPLGTYTGWNVRRTGFSQGDACDLTGGYIPFAGTQAQRTASGDSRLSLQERYTGLADYQQHAKSAANELVEHGLLLQSDENAAIKCAVSQAAQAAAVADTAAQAAGLATLNWGAGPPASSCNTGPLPF